MRNRREEPGTCIIINYGTNDHQTVFLRSLTRSGAARRLVFLWAEGPYSKAGPPDPIRRLRLVADPEYRPHLRLQAGLSLAGDGVAAGVLR